MKGLGILLMVASLAIAPSYGSAQQSAEKAQPPTKEPAKESLFPENKNVEEFKFPENQSEVKGQVPTGAGEEFKFPEPQSGATGTSPATPPKGEKGKVAQAQPLKNYSPKEKKAYLKQTSADLTALQKRIDVLKVKEEYKTVQRKRANMMIMVGLQKKALNARTRLTALEKSPDMAWSGQKIEMDNVMVDLQKSCSDTLQFFEE